MIIFRLTKISKYILKESTALNFRFLIRDGGPFANIHSANLPASPNVVLLQNFDVTLL